MKQSRPRRFGRYLWQSWLRPCLPVLLIIVTIRSAVADWSDVPTGSMKPTILEGDRVLINKAAYSIRFPLTRWHMIEFDGPKRGDIVVFQSPKDGKRLVKRVVAIPGDTIEMRNGRLFLNGEPIVYEPLQRDQIPVGSDSLDGDWILNTEQLPERAHAVISQPGIPSRRNFSSIAIPADHFFAMGDNRDNSLDSRYFGPVNRDMLFGAATHVAFSLDPKRYRVPRWNRFFSPLD